MKNSWQVIGLALGASQNYLDGLICTQDDPIIKLSNVIRKWMDSQSSPVIWKTLISSIEGSIVNNKRKDDKIRDYLDKLIIIVKLIIMHVSLYDTLSLRYSWYFMTK